MRDARTSPGRVARRVRDGVRWGRGRQMLRWIVAGLSLLASATASAGADADAEGQIPAPFVPFEHMIGSWKGQGIPAVNRLRGWPEKHLWAWKFAKGIPVGMSLTLEGNKTLSKAELTCDADGQHYRLQGTTPEGQ